MPKLTLDELRKGREEARSNIHLRGEEFKGKVIVHMGTCGVAAGARDIVLAFLDQKERRQVTDILVTTSGCAGLCSKNPWPRSNWRTVPRSSTETSPRKRRQRYSKNTSLAVASSRNTPSA